MNPARRRALEALKRQRATAPAPLFEEPQEAEPDVGIDRVAVLFPLPLPEPFDYRASSLLNLQPGQHVIAPIGTRLWRGVVWRVERNSAAAANLKAIEEVLPGATIPDISRTFLDWAAKYLVTSPGNLIGMIARSPEALLPAPTYAVYRAAAEPPPRMTDARARVLRIASEEALPGAELARRAEVSSGVVRALIDSGALVREERSEDPPFQEPNLE
jgi:primosomal protein N' (replication factor Y)